MSASGLPQKQYLKVYVFVIVAVLLGYSWLVFVSLFRTGNILSYGDVMFHAVRQVKSDYKIEPIPAVSTGCNPFLLENCASKRFRSELLQEPEVVAKIIDAIRNPCTYLADPQGETVQDELHRSWLAERNNVGNWQYLQCGAQQKFSEKVVVNFVNERGRIDIRITKPAVAEEK